MTAIGTPESIGESNKKLILRELRRNGDMSRADLSRSLGMSFPAVSSNVTTLLEKQYLHEVGAGANSFGRKSTMLSYNAQRGFVAGVDIGRTRIRCMLADLGGEQVATATRFSDAGDFGDQIIKKICDAVAGVCTKGNVPDNQLLAVCIGLPGLTRNGRIYLAPNFSEFSLGDLSERMARKYAATIIYENGVNLGAKGEHWRGVGQGISHFAYVSYGAGLGAALILDNRLYTGIHGAAGEVGFMTLSPDSPRTSFKESGELEEALVNDALRGHFPGHGSSADIADFFRGGGANKRTAKDALERIVRSIGMALVNLSAVVNPEAIIISGRMGKAVGDQYHETWTGMLAANLPFPPKILFSQLHNQETMLGAVGTAIDHIENMPIATEV